MKKLLLTLVSLFVFALQASYADDPKQLAFPGADGYAKYVTGGRGGEVCYVTRLDDCTDTNLVPGTLRWALRHDNGGKPRTILFKVSGTIYLTSKLKFQYPDVSILGQSAPGGGICLSGFNMYVCKSNVIIRYVRFRAGDIPNSSMTGLDIENAKNVILDHCSMTWSMEECLTAYDTDNTTIQWCIIGEGLYSSKNAKGTRAYAMQWAGEHSTMHHTLITNSHSRSPRFNGVRSYSNNRGDHDYKVDSEFANNVIFNWSGTGAIHGGEYDASKAEKSGTWTDDDKGYDRVYLINNYYRPGPSSKVCNTQPYFAAPSSPYGEWYVSGNKLEESGTYSPWTASSAQSVNNNNTGALSGLPSKYQLSALPYALSGLEYESAEAAYSSVVTKSGASLPRYDEVDRRLLDEAAGKVAPLYVGESLKAHGDYGIIDSPDDVALTTKDTYYADGVAYSNYPSLAMREGDKYAKDTDGDGLPDLYEDEKGLDKNNANDGAEVASNGYTNLENYLNDIADGVIDKKKYETLDTPDFEGEMKMLSTSEGSSVYEGWFVNGMFCEAGKEHFVPNGATLQPVVKVVFDYEGLDPVILATDKKITMPKAEKQDYNFLGWSDGNRTYDADAQYNFATSVTLSPVFSKQTGPVERALYSTNFQNWNAASSSTKAASQTFTTDITNEKLTFTYCEVQVAPNGTHDKFISPTTAGYLMGAKTATPYIETSALKNISTVTFVHCATAGSRGWGLMAKGDGDADWVKISTDYANPAGGCTKTVEVNRTNCQLRFFNLAPTQNAYMTDLVIRGKVDLPEGIVMPLQEKKGGAVYNAVGQRMSTSDMPRGIYIVKGKKIVK